MNKKNAFTVIVQSPKKMELETANRSINVMLVVNSFQEELGLIQTSFGKNIKKENKPMNSYLKSINVQSEPSKERLIYTKPQHYQKHQEKLSY